MNDTLQHLKLMRLLKAFAIGLAIGVAILAVYFTPQAIQSCREAAAAAMWQENLLPANGQAFASFAMAEVSLTVLLDGSPREGMSVAADRGFFGVSSDGRLDLQLAPGRYTFIAGYENRRLLFPYEVLADQPNKIVLEVNKAPSAPDLRIWDIYGTGDHTIQLGISGADEVSTQNLPEGIRIEKRQGEFVLAVDSDKLPPGFWCLRLTAQNQYGDATMFACLRLPRNTAPTPIYTVEELDSIRHNLLGHYVLMNDIDMSSIDDWRPIGTENSPFCGIFDGGGYEISGFHAPAHIEDGFAFGLFGYTKNAELRNIIIREPVITPQVPARELGIVFGSYALAYTVMHSLVEDCATLGGMVKPSDGNVGGLMVGMANSVVLGCFSSTDVFCSMANSYLPNVGGISGGVSRSYVSLCANEGEVKGNHLTGGIAGYGDMSHVTRCINSGYIWGSTIVGAVPAGGIIQANDQGISNYSYFVRGLAPRGAHSSNGLVADVLPVDVSELRQPGQLTMLGTLGGDAPQWAYASLDARGPIPYGIFKEQAASPVVQQNGNNVVVAPVDGVRYFYTLDGSDPYTYCAEPAQALNITLRQGQVLQVFAAKQGCRDSDMVMAEGGK